MATPSVTPPVLPVYVHRVEEIQGTWWVAETKTNHEKKVARFLADNDIGYCLPWERVKVYVGRDEQRREQDRLLFRGYVFACFKNDKERYALEDMPTQGLRRRSLLAVNNQERLKRELAIVNPLLGTGCIQWDFDPQVGGWVQIAHGPYRGQRGRVLENRAGKLVCIIEIETLGRWVSYEIPRDFLEQAA